MSASTSTAASWWSGLASFAALCPSVPQHNAATSDTPDNYNREVKAHVQIVAFVCTGVPVYAVLMHSTSCAGRENQVCPTGRCRRFLNILIHSLSKNDKSSSSNIYVLLAPEIFAKICPPVPQHNAETSDNHNREVNLKFELLAMHIICQCVYLYCWYRWCRTFGRSILLPPRHHRPRPCASNT